MSKSLAMTALAIGIAAFANPSTTPEPPVASSEEPSEGTPEATEVADSPESPMEAKTDPSTPPSETAQTEPRRRKPRRPASMPEAPQPENGPILDPWK